MRRRTSVITIVLLTLAACSSSAPTVPAPDSTTAPAIVTPESVGPTTSAPPAPRSTLVPARGITIDAPSEAAVRVVATSPAPGTDAAHGTEVTLQGAGRFSPAPIQLVFPRTEQQANPLLARDRIAYFDDALERWAPLPTTVHGDTLTASSIVATGRYGVITLAYNWEVDRASALENPTCGPPPSWYRETFPRIGSPEIAVCVEAHGAGARIRLTNTTAGFVAYDLPQPAVAVAVEHPPHPELQRLIEPTITTSHLALGAETTIVVDIDRPDPGDELFTLSGDDAEPRQDLAFASALFELAHARDSRSSVLTAPTGTSTVGAGIIACSSDGRSAAILRGERGSIDNDPYAQCVLHLVDDAIATRRGGEPLDQAHRTLAATDPRAAELLDSLVAYRLLFVEAFDHPGSGGRGNGDGPSIGWGPQSTTTTVRIGAPANLFGIPIGTDAEIARQHLVQVLGPPTSDTGWLSPTPKCDYDRTLAFRLVQWDNLSVLLDRLPDGDSFGMWTYAAPTSGPDRYAGVIVFANEVTFGKTMERVSALTGLALSQNVFDETIAVDRHGQFGIERRQFTGFGLSPSTPFSHYDEPVRRYCDD